MSDSHATEGTDAWRFAIALQALCPGEFYGEPRKFEWLIKLVMRNGATLLVRFRKGGYVSNLDCESGRPSSSVLAKLEELVRGNLVRFDRRPELERAIIDWRTRPAIRLVFPALTESSFACRQSCEEESTTADRGRGDPIGEIPTSGTSGVRKNAHRLAPRSPLELGAESGWSQAIGRRCEQFAFEALCEVMGDQCVRVDGDESRVVLRLPAGDRIFEWLNADTERFQSWDLQELDMATGEVLRRHEVKAPSARLTPLEQVLAIGYGNAYLVWRMDPDAGTCMRVKTQDSLPR